MKNLFKKTLLSTSILSIALLASSVTVANDKMATEQLSAAETKEVLHELTEDMAAKGIKVAFQNTPKMTYDVSLNADLDELARAAERVDINATGSDDTAWQTLAPLTQQAQRQILANVLKDLSADGMHVDFGNQPPKIEHLTVDNDDAQTDDAQYKATLKDIATEMLNSGSAANAAKVYEELTYPLNGDVTQQALDMVQDELASQGYKATFSGKPMVTIDQSVWQQDDTKPLTANDKRALIADMQSQLAEAGIIADLSKYQPRIERLPLPEVAVEFDEKAFAELEASYDAELNQMAQQVMKSGSLDKAADIIAAFEQAGDETDLGM